MAKNKQSAPQATVPNQSLTESITEIRLTEIQWFLILLGSLAFMSIYIYGDFLFGSKMFLFKDIGSDTLNGLYPYIYQNAAYYEEYGTWSWSFKNGMGQSLFPFVFRDPFDAILFFVDKNNLVHWLGWKEVFKILSAGTLFFYFLKCLGINGWPRLIGALAYSFSGFMIVGGGWYLFSSEAVIFAMLLLGFEHALQRKNAVLFGLGIGLFALSMPFNLYLYGLFLLAYMILRVYTLKPSLTRLLYLIGTLFLWTVAGLLIAAPFLMENIVQLLESPRGSGDYSYATRLRNKPVFELSSAQEFGSVIHRLFSNNSLGVGNDFKGWQNTLESPMIYTGIWSLLLTPLLFQHLSKKDKWAYGIFLAFWLLPLIYPFFRRAFWLFTGDYYRAYSLILVFTFILFAAKAWQFIQEKGKVNLLPLGITVVGLLALFNFSYFDGEVKDAGVVGMVHFFLLIVAGLILAHNFAKNHFVLAGILSLVIAGELLLTSDTSVNGRSYVTAEEWKDKIGYNDHSRQVLAKIQKEDKGFFRISKYYTSSPAMHYGLNDALVQDFYGTSQYNSFAEKSYVDYFKGMRIISDTNEFEARWIPGLNARPLLENLNSVKYSLAKEQRNPNWIYTHDSITKIGDVTVFKNKYFLPLGFVYNKWMSYSDFKKLPQAQLDFVAYQTAVVDDAYAYKVKELSRYKLRDTLPMSQFTFQKLDTLRRDLLRDTLEITSFSDINIKGKIDMTETGILYLSIPRDKGWKIVVDGKKRTHISMFNGMTGVLIEKGKHEVEMTYEHRFLGTGKSLSLAGMVMLLAITVVGRIRRKPEEEDFLSEDVQQEN